MSVRAKPGLRGLRGVCQGAHTARPSGRVEAQPTRARGHQTASGATRTEIGSNNPLQASSIHVSALAETHLRGQGLVEFALVLPILLLVAFGIINFAYIFAAHTNLVHAAREGVRYGMVRPDDVEGICTRVEEHVVLTAYEPSNVTVSYPDIGDEPTFTCDAPGSGVDPEDIDVGNDRVVVAIVDNLTPLTPLIPFSFDVDVLARRTITAKPTPTP